MNTETVTVDQKGEDFKIIVQHDQSGSAYGMPLSKNAYEQLRQHFVSGSLQEHKQVIRDLMETYIINLDENGSPKASIADIMKLIDRAVELVGNDR